MGRFGLGSGLAIVALAISGCGTVSTPDPAANTTVTASVPNPAPNPAPSAATGRAHGGGPQSVESPDDGSQTPPPSPVFPLTIRRTGGIAQFDDTITLRSDGRVNVETRSVHDRTCTLDRARQRELVAALGTLNLGAGSKGVPDPPADGSDGIGGTVGGDSSGDTSQIIFSVVDARGRSVDLGEPSLASVLTMITSLVSDVTLSQPATRCTTNATGAATQAGL